MRNAILSLALIAACAVWASPDAGAMVLADGLRTAADEMNAVESVADLPLRHCSPGGCGWHHHHHHYRGCPDRLSCMPLYGAYGPWGGAGYWGSFSYPWAR